MSSARTESRTMRRMSGRAVVDPPSSAAPLWPPRKILRSRRNRTTDTRTNNPAVDGQPVREPSATGLPPDPGASGERPVAPAARWEFLLPASVAVGLFLVRYAILGQVTYPPSGDAAGDLVWIHAYLGHPLPLFT